MYLALLGASMKEGRDAWIDDDEPGFERDTSIVSQGHAAVIYVNQSLNRTQMLLKTRAVRLSSAPRN